MKTFCTIVLLILLCSCARNDDGTTQADIEAARSAGARDAMAAAATDSLSYGRDSALMEMRARESQLREAGFPCAADAYAQSAAQTLLRMGLIHEIRQ